MTQRQLAEKYDGPGCSNISPFYEWLPLLLLTQLHGQYYYCCCCCCCCRRCYLNVLGYSKPRHLYLPSAGRIRATGTTEAEFLQLLKVETNRRGLATPSQAITRCNYSHSTPAPRCQYQRRPTFHEAAAGLRRLCETATGDETVPKIIINIYFFISPNHGSSSTNNSKHSIQQNEQTNRRKGT